MRRFALFAIHCYQRYISPYKGFRCAYSVHTRCASCSSLGYRAVRRYGVLGGLSILRKRTYLCGVAHRRFAVQSRRPLRSQRGDCDMGCDAPVDSHCDCDMPSGRSLAKSLDFVDCCDFVDCDGPKRKRKKSKDEGHVYLRPPISKTLDIQTSNWG